MIVSRSRMSSCPPCKLDRLGCRRVISGETVIEINRNTPAIPGQNVSLSSQDVLRQRDGIVLVH